MSPSTTGDAALSVPVSLAQKSDGHVLVPPSGPIQEHGGVQAEDQVHAETETRLQGQSQNEFHLGQRLSASANTSAPSQMPVPDAPGGVDHPGRSSSGHQAMAVPSNHDEHVAPHQNDKLAKGPVSTSATATASAAASAAASAVPRRPNGPSLLTQQLAEARGIPVPAGHNSDLPKPSARAQQPSPYDPSTAIHPKRDATAQGSDPRSRDGTKPVDPASDDSHESDLTPRASPRAIPMASTPTVSTLSLLPRNPDIILSHTLHTSDARDVNTRPRSHRDVFQTNGRGLSLERTNRETRPKDLTFSARTYSDTSAPPTGTTAMTLDSHIIQPNGKSDPSSTTGPRSPTRPHKPDQRPSTGPEKVWSIGSEDLNNAQDGQVEKSIAEVLAGVEPSARSRKASHSLRFFKEGLPEEHLKRRDSRIGPKEKVAVTDDALLPTGTVHSGEHSKSLQPSPGPVGEQPGRLTRTRTFPLPSTESQHDDESPGDYFRIRPEDKWQTEPVNEVVEQQPDSPESQTVNTPPTPQQEDDEHGDASDAVNEDAELSGEEKISSAVFVPHKGLQDVPESPEEAEEDFESTGKSQPRSDDGSAWLVKADEPEADDPVTPTVHPEDETSRGTSHQYSEPEHLSIDEGEKQQKTISEPAVTAVSDYGPRQPKDVKPVTQISPNNGNGDHVHDHQLGPDHQPLDAIELVPYRHQVGGHTTLWRFSKRAVCKQLNNRENEFYEQIEKHHRDLLPFLPRYAIKALFVFVK